MTNDVAVVDRDAAMLVTPADHVVWDTWNRTQGSPDERARAVIDLAGPSASLRASPLLRRIREALDTGAATQIATFASAASSTRGHDRTLHGVRAGGFVSTHQVRFAAEPRRLPEGTPRENPPELAKWRLFGAANVLSREQRDWCVAVASGDIDALRPPSVPVIDQSALLNIANRLHPLALSIGGNIRRGEACNLGEQAILECALGNLADPGTKALIKHTLSDGHLGERAALSRAFESAYDLKTTYPKVPWLKYIDIAGWCGDASSRAYSAGVARGFGEVARDEGDHNAAASFYRLAATFGDAQAAGDAKLSAVSLLISRGSYEPASTRLAMMQGAAISELGGLLAAYHPVRIPIDLLDRLANEGHGSLAAVLEQRGCTPVDGWVTLPPVTPLDPDVLIARGRALLSPELMAKWSALVDLRLERMRQRPPSAEISRREEDAYFELQKFMPDLLDKLTPQGGIDYWQAIGLTAGLGTSASVRLWAPNIDQSLIGLVRLLGARGLGLVDSIRVDSNSPSIDPELGEIKLERSGNEDRQRADLFHEMGHAAEFADPAFRDAALSWLKRRAGGRPHYHLSALGFKSAAQAYAGGFATPYVGRIYPPATQGRADGEVLLKSRGATEVTSTAFERFATSASLTEFLAADLEHFCLVAGWLLS